MTALNNTDRAARADLAITAYGEDCRESNLIYLLADAMHWCEQHRQNFNRLLAQAGRHYVQELIKADGDQGRRP